VPGARIAGASRVIGIDPIPPGRAEASSVGPEMMDMLNIHALDFGSTAKALRGKFLGNANPRDLPRLLTLWRAGKLDLEAWSPASDRSPRSTRRSTMCAPAPLCGPPSACARTRWSTRSCSVEISTARSKHSRARPSVTEPVAAAGPAAPRLTNHRNDGQPDTRPEARLTVMMTHRPVVPVDITTIAVNRRPGHPPAADLCRRAAVRSERLPGYQYALVADALERGEMAGKSLGSETMRWWRRLGWWVPAAIATLVAIGGVLVFLVTRDEGVPAYLDGPWRAADGAVLPDGTDGARGLGTGVRVYQGDAECFESVTFMEVAWPPGSVAPPSDEIRQFVRDRDDAYEGLPGEFERDVEPPADAEATGVHTDDVELWIAASQEGVVYLRHADGTFESWPRAEPPAGCA
jgi:hypothetical protein